MKKLRAIFESVLLFGIVYLVYEIMYYGYVYVVRFSISMAYPWPDVSDYGIYSLDEMSLYYVRDHPIEYTLICWGLILFIVLFVMLASRQSIKALFQMKALGLRNSLAVIITGVGMVIAVNGVIRFLANVLDEDVNYLANELFVSYELMTILLTVGVLIPICEEVFFRGLVISRLKLGFGPIMVVMISSLIFSFSHLNLAQSLLILPVGILCGTLMIKTQSILSAISLHIIYNVLNIYLDKIHFFQYNSLQLLVMVAMGLALMAFGVNQLRENTPEY